MFKSYTKGMGRIKVFNQTTKPLRIPAMDRSVAAQKKFVKETSQRSPKNPCHGSDIAVWMKVEMKPNNEALRILAMDRTPLYG
jgi:hypothetical protein